MKLNVQKISQGPVLAKGSTVAVTDSTDCGWVGKPVGAGCTTNLGTGNGQVSYGYNPNTQTASVQYTNNSCC